MKLVGTKGKRLSTPSNNRVQSTTTSNKRQSTTTKSKKIFAEMDKNKKTGTVDNSNHSPKRKGRFGRLSRNKKVLVIASCVVGLMLILGVSTFAVVRWQVQPFYDYFFRPGESDLATLPAIVLPNDENPSVDSQTGTEGDVTNTNTNTVDPPPSLEMADRDINHINFLLLGIDEHGNTDVIMLASFHTENSTLNIVSIPRDTMVNVSWNIRKANSIHAYMRNRHRNESDRAVRDNKIAESTIEHFRDVFGFHADYMVTVTFGAFRRIINAVGPIPYNVPVRVSVDGVTVPSGPQRLNGAQALAVMRSRNSYANHAIGRDYAQQEFLSAVASTVISANWSASKIAEMVDVFFNEVSSSSIPVRHQIGFGRDFMQLNMNDISFSMMPGAIDSARGNSYITILVDEWLELINEKFNPFSRDITVHDVSILTRGPDRRLMVTDGNWQGSSNWAAGSLGPSNPSLTIDSSRAVPGRASPAQLEDGGDRDPVTDGGGD